MSSAFWLWNLTPTDSITSSVASWICRTSSGESNSSFTRLPT